MSKRLTENDTIPVLDGWITLPDAANILKISRQHAYNRAANGHFKSLHRVGSSVFLVDEAEIRDLTVVNEQE